MKVSLKWLKTMVDIPVEAKDLANKLDLTGTAVESIESTGQRLDGVVVGQIIKRGKHPNADTLWVTSVDVGQHNVDENGDAALVQIVCGAQNFDAGDKVPVALVGAVLPNGLEIKKAKLRGIESRGMNCSGRELGLSDDAAGLLILPADAPVGTAFADYLQMGDTVLDLEITPNRPDCMSMLGVAREIGAVYNIDYCVGREVPKSPIGEPVENLVRVTIDDEVRCPRYTARVIKGVKVGPSPEWLVERVTAAGARSINNIVDVSNYIMYELGQPLHAFDLETLTKDEDGRVHIVVRAANEGEQFTTLDGVKRTLTSDITAIVDGNGSAAGTTSGINSEAGTSDNAANAPAGSGTTIALAGVMGGEDSEVSDKTVNILLESATFSSAHTSRTSRNLQLFSESSARYERGVDAETCDEFSARAAALMVEVAGGVVCEGVVDVYPAPKQIEPLLFRVERFCEFIGADIPRTNIEHILTRLGCEVAEAGDSAAASSAATATATAGDPAVTAATDANLSVTPPSYRPDLTREVDLYEEVLRIWGMDRVPSTLPGGRERIGERSREQELASTINLTLRAGGLNQTMTYAFAAPDDQDRLMMPAEDWQEAVELINPMNSEQSVLRRSIIPGLLRSVAYNQSHGVANVHLYEIGTVFFASEGRKQPKERQLIAAVLAGSWSEAAWNQSRVELDFFDGKGLLENLMRELCVQKLRFKALDVEKAPWLQPGRAAEILAGSKHLGWLGEVHPLACEAFGAAAPVVAFELDLKSVISVAEAARPFKDVPQYPAVDIDLALVVDEQVTAERVEQVLRSAAGALLDELRLFDVYRDVEKVGEGKKSLAFSLSYRASDRTLTSEEVELVHQKVIRKVKGATGGEVRG